MTNRLSDSIKFLRNAAPDEFEQFRQAFAQFSAEASDTLIKSVEKLKVLQGQAQMCVKVLQLLNGGEPHGK